MGTTIDGATLVTGGWRTHSSALRLAVRATRHALEQTGQLPGDVDLLINTGLYRDHNLGEPALAPLIQDDAHVNPSDPHPGGVGTFSFDVANGSCGVLTALQIADGFMATKTVATTIVVASDANPGHGLAPTFPFKPAGGALVCHHTDSDRGLGPFRWHNCPDNGDTFRATVGLEGDHNVLTIREEAAFAESVGEVAAVAAGRVLDDSGITALDIDLVIASPARPAFTRVLSSRLGIPEDRFVTAGPDMHTVAFVAAFEAAKSSGRLDSAGTVLFVCGAAGLTAGAAMYRP